MIFKTNLELRGFLLDAAAHILVGHVFDGRDPMTAADLDAAVILQNAENQIYEEFEAKWGSKS